MRRVLIVEDEAAIRNLLAAILRRERIVTDTAENGREALRQLAKHEYACIVLDLMMPVMNGREVVEALSGLPPAGRRSSSSQRLPTRSPRTCRLRS